jgi:hypothetical protein
MMMSSEFQGYKNACDSQKNVAVETQSSKSFFHTESPHTFSNIGVKCHVLPKNEFFTETVYHQ